MKLHDWAGQQPDILNSHAERKVLHTPSLTFAELRLKKGAIVPRHSHINEQISVVQSGKLAFDFDGREVIVEAGNILEIAPNLPHAVVALEETVVFDIFTPMREDWQRGDDAYLRGATPSLTR